MMAFLDTSSLIKLYHHEDGSDWIMETLSHNKIEDIFLSELAILEFRSALWKKVRVKELEERVF
ncbi:type II toxin-antitoxin system VapC family toxin [Deltaproteobacteria bacterium TL4]